MHLGLAYRTKTTIHSHGNASGNAGAQFDALGIPFQPDFHYTAEVDTHLPQAFNGGVSIDGWRHTRFHLQAGWIGWSGAFQQLPVNLTNGSNTDINTFLGSSSLSAIVPLHWNDQETFGLGFETPLTETFDLRAGYSYATNPVPASTLTPMTAAILQHTLGTGVGYSRGPLRFDLTYQAQLPATQSVGQSGLLAGGYDNSRVHVMVQSLTLTTRIRF